jgi:outer membrane receptor for ferrienterochelin and colicins
MRNRLIFILICFECSFSIAIQNAYAQTRTIEGSVIDAITQEPVSGVKVELKQSGIANYSNSEGNYTLEVPDSIENIEFSDFDSLNLLEVKKVSEFQFDIYVSKVEFLKLTLDELLNIKVITASKSEEKLSDAAAVISIVTAEDIKMYASRDLTDILDRVTGTFIYGSYYLPNNMISIRGEVTSHYCTHILLLLNGRPLRSSKEGYFLPIIRAFPIETIERIEILRGPGSALYGSGAYAGIVNIITKQGKSPTTTSSMQVGSFGTGSAQIATAISKKYLNITAAGYYLHSNGWDYKVRGALSDSLYPETNTPAVETSKGLYVFAGYKGLTLNSYLGENYQMIGQPSQLWWYANEWYLNTRKIFTDLGYTHEFGKKLTTTFNFTYNYLKYWQPYDVHANDFREWGIFNDFVCEISNIYKASEKITVTLGGLTNNQTGYILNTETLSDGTPYNVWTNPKNPDPFYVVPKYNETWWCAYGNINYKPFPFISFIVGAHANKVTHLDLDVVPRLGTVINFGIPLTLKCLYGQAFRSPDFFELYSKVNGIYGNKYLKPEKITTLEFQMAYVHEKINIAIDCFDNSQKNLIGRSLASDSLLIVDGIPQPIFINNSELKSHGLELEGELRATSKTRLFFSAMYHINENSKGDKNIYGLPNVFLKVGIQHSFGNKINIGVFNMWVSKGNEFNVPFPKANHPANAFNYATLKLSFNISKLLNLKTEPDILFDFTGYNLLNAKIYYPEYGDKTINTIPARPGIGLYGGLKINF